MNEGSKPLLLSLPREGEFVFPGKNGNHWVDIKRAVNEIKEKAGLPKDFRPLHGLRHSFASLLAEKGVDLLTISKLLTHSSVKVSERYAHLTDKTKQEASNRVVEIIKQAIPQ